MTKFYQFHKYYDIFHELLSLFSISLSFQKPSSNGFHSIDNHTLIMWWTENIAERIIKRWNEIHQKRTFCGMENI